MENWKTKNATNTTKNFFFRRNKSCQLEKKSLIMSSKYRKLSSPIEPFRALSSPMITTQQQQKKIKQKRNKNKEMQRRGARGEEKEEGKRKEEVQEAKIEVEGRKSVCVAYGFLLFGAILPGIQYLYLGLYTRAFLCMVSLNGFGLAWFWDVFNLPWEVHRASQDKYYKKENKFLRDIHPSPPFSFPLFFSCLFFSFFFGRYSNILFSLSDLVLLKVASRGLFSGLGAYLCVYSTDKQISLPKILTLSLSLHLLSHLLFPKLSPLLPPTIALLSQFLLSWSPPQEQQKQGGCMGFLKGLLVVVVVVVVFGSVLGMGVENGSLNIEYNDFDFETDEDWWGGLLNFLESFSLHEAYTILGLREGATEKEVNSAFRKLSVKAHPDRGGTAEEYQTIVDARNLILKHLEIQKHHNKN